MKKKNLLIVSSLVLILGTFAGFATHFAIESKASEIAVLAEEVSSAQQSEETEEITPEEKSRIQELIEELKRKYDQIKDIQVAGTTIGALAGALVGAIVSFVPSMLNRANIKKALETVAVCKDNMSKVNEFAVDIKSKFDVSNRGVEFATAKVRELMNELEALERALEQTEANCEAVLADAKKSFELLKEKHDRVEESIVYLVGHSKEYVANGAAEYVKEKLGK